MTLERMFDGETPPAQFDDGSPLSLGTRFKVLEACKATAARIYFGSNPTGTPVQFALYRLDDSLQLATATFNTTTPSSWNEAPLSVEVDLSPLYLYIAVFLTGGRYVAQAAYPWPDASPRIVTDSDSAGRYAGGATIQIPNSSFNNGCYFVGIVANFNDGGTTRDYATLDLRWRAAARNVSNLDLRWRTATRAASTLDLRWRTATRVTTNLDLRWRTSTRAASTLDLRWRTATRAASNLDLRWATATRNSTTLDLRWRTQSSTLRLTSDLDLRWRTYERGSQVLDLPWRSYSRVYSELDIRWRTYQRLSSSVNLPWRTFTRSTSVLDLRWRTIQRRFSNLTLLWRTEGESPQLPDNAFIVDRSARTIEADVEVLPAVRVNRRAAAAWRVDRG